MSAFEGKAYLHIHVWRNRRIVLVPGNGRSMALDANTFLMVLVAAIVVMGIVVWVMFKKAS
jgi:hypothetical protein